MPVRVSRRCDLAIVPGVHAALVDADLVLLDVRSDAYFCLPGLADDFELRADRRRLALADPGLARDLLAAGLVSGEMAPAAQAVPIPPHPQRSALCVDYPCPAWGDLGEGLRAMFDLARAYRGRRLHAILEAVARPSPGIRPQASPAVIEAAARFHRWAPYAPVSGKCLLRSFMLLRLLRAKGLDALWVFGVRTWPFQAHCWLQCEDLVLDDQPDRVRAFTPIMAA